jgi:hypothetical protein
MPLTDERVGFNHVMDQQPDGPPSMRLDDALARLEAAAESDDEGRLSVLEELHSVLQEELDAAEAPSPGR